MATIPLPALAIQPPQQQTNPLEEYKNLIGLKSLLNTQQLQQQLAPGQIQEQQQRIKSGELENQQQQMAVSQTQAINKAYSDALSVDENGNPNIDQQHLQKSLAASGHGAAIPTILKNTADYQKSFADAQKAQQDVQSSMQDSMGSVGKAIQSANYDPGVADLLLQHQLATPNLPAAYKQQLMQTEQQLKTNPAAIKTIADSLVATSQKQQQFQNALQVAGVRANTPEAKELTDFLSRNPDMSASDYPGWKEKQTAQASQAAQTSPAAIQGAAKKASAEEAARLGQQNSPAAVQGAADKAVAVQKATTGGAQAALANVPPHLVGPATAAAQKAGENFTQAQQAADDMDSMVSLAKKGNKIAYAYSPVTGVLQINVAGQTKRINTTEIEQYGGAGSAWDRVKGFLGKQVSGASIPDDVLNDMSSVSKTYRDNAGTKYQRDLDVTNSTYGSNFTVPKSLQTPRKPNTNTQSFQMGQKISIKGQQKTVTVTKVYPDGSFDVN